MLPPLLLLPSSKYTKMVKHVHLLGATSLQCIWLSALIS